MKKRYVKLCLKLAVGLSFILLGSLVFYKTFNDFVSVGSLLSILFDYVVSEYGGLAGMLDEGALIDLLRADIVLGMLNFSFISVLVSLFILAASCLGIEKGLDWSVYSIKELLKIRRLVNG